MSAFRKTVSTEAELRQLAGGEPSALALAKELGTLDVHCRAFIARSPFLLLATSGAAGRCDVSPKGDGPGFVQVLDDRHLRAWIVRDADLLASCQVRGKGPVLGIGVEVEGAFIHCAKAFKRSGLREPERWPDLSGLASPATMLHGQTRPPGVTVADVERALQDSYTNRLY